MNMTEPVQFTSMTPQPLRGELRCDVPMSKHVSWRAGGLADRAYIPADLGDFAAFVRALPPAEPLLVVGLGSNLLVRDGGFRGTVVLLHGVLSTVSLLPATGDGAATRVHFEAGVACPKVARFAAMHGLEGAEFLAGIPGTMGGALAMNAGCYGSQTWDRVVAATLLTRDGRLVERVSGDFDLGYRHVALAHASREGPMPLLGRDEWFVGATLQLDAGDGTRSRARIKEFLSRRIATQPLQQPNAGSVFRNPPGDHAARLIEACGLKGMEIGGAEVSTKHANFIVNRGGATASDIEALVEAVRQRVLLRTGVDLVPEVRIVGDA
ncbi:MAG: UDP-N-acetylmuramate dehydrogenase [Rhodocyclaceae bacterium]|jgi:UDP-N-acetylmuramate dehydrogenase|nr:UDP-N-acetylmuramate dehydrogenase [Rhodocyclaceae bacterium]MCE2980214.1 UDP-N-acetylmuramate dehydrogenase [Betaproteobacteria bacterium]MCA3075457.1 UDP-N-acetylmuramate dehydrogenase [Rhodocyclaceae bacterium]MCA3092132.1 UDP-N-acetylmuramate dehydrogenase [Rhodocyclaceae bacterium]MCA3095911.1 UDP-N-acetylmuramate dehydrogenase [Rhodocyclaceae bacterium]